MADTAVKWLPGEALDEILTLPGAVLVMFSAQWCPPCQVLLPRMERLASRYGSRLGCYAIDVDAAVETAAQYAVRGMPMLALFVDGDLEATRVGALDEAQLDTFVGSSL